MSNLQQIFEENAGLSVRKFADTTGATYYKLLTASRKPIEGEVYDPKAVNWTEMEKAMTKEQLEVAASTDWSAVEVTATAKVQQDTTVFQPGTKWHLRRHGWAEIVYRNDSYIVFVIEGTEQPKSWAIDTWLINGPSDKERK